LFQLSLLLEHKLNLLLEHKLNLLLELKLNLLLELNLVLLIKQIWLNMLDNLVENRKQRPKKIWQIN
jgi:hypothetical protein